MNDVRARLTEAEKECRAELDRLNEVLKHILLARSKLDEEEPEPEPEPDLSLKPGAPVEDDPITAAGKKQGTKYRNLSMRTMIIDALPDPTGKPIDSVGVHQRLIDKGWKTTSKDSLLAVRNALSRLRHDIHSEKIGGVLHYRKKPLEELM